MKVLSAELRRIRADLHIHSNHSDGRDCVKKILEFAVKRGIDVVSITDHNTVQGSLEALDLVREEHMPVMVIPGVEVSSADGHVLVYGVYKDVFEKGIEFDELRAIASKVKALTSLAHPFQFFRHGALRLRCFEMVECIETFNAKSPPLFNTISKILCRKYGKGETAGSDAHRAEYVGYGYVDVFVNAKSVDDVLKALRNGMCRTGGRLYGLKVLRI